MATNPSRSQAVEFARLLADLEPEVRRAFMASVTDLQAGVDWPLLLLALQRQDIGGAIAALNIDAAAWAEYSSVMTNAYAVAGASTAAQIRATPIYAAALRGGGAAGETVASVGIRFRMTNPGAQAWIRENVAERVVGFAEEQQRVARQVIEAGYAAGQGPQNIAVDLAGRVQRGQRVGGVLGLDGPRAERLQNVVQGMRTPEGVKSLVVRGQDGTLSVRYKVNKATEARILRAYRDGVAVSPVDRRLSADQYRNALILERAETVAATETANAVMSARAEEWSQAAQQMGLNESAVRKTWRHRRGGDGRPDHIAMSGQSVMGLHTPFIMPDGTAMQHPHDPAGGAKHNIRCGCDCTFQITYGGLE